jgi:hypothetical protein
VDIAGAKALKERLGHKGTPGPAAPAAEVSEGAPPVYHYLGVSDTPPDAPVETPADEPRGGRPRSLLRRLRLTLR